MQHSYQGEINSEGTAMDLGRSSEEYSSESSGQHENYGNILNQEQVASSIKVCLFYNSIYGMIEVLSLWYMYLKIYNASVFITLRC